MINPYFVHYNLDRDLICALKTMPKEIEKAKTAEDLYNLSCEAEIIAHALRYKYLKLFFGRVQILNEKKDYEEIPLVLSLNQDLFECVSKVMDKVYEAHRIRFKELGGF